jgi:hypothetical protein
VRAIDSLGNVDPSPASFTWTIDLTPPSVTINQASSQADSTSASPIHFTVAFTEAVAGIADGDVTLSGTAGATTAVVSELAPFDGTTYDVSVSGMTAGGAVSASIAAAVASDAAGNGNLASTSSDNTVTFVPNAPPTADAGGPYSVSEGASVLLDGTGSSDPDQDAASLTYVWDLDGDAIFGETGAAAANGAETGSAPTFVTAELDGPGSVSVTLRVTDNADVSDDATVAITLVNSAPTASLSGPSNGAVAQALSFALGASDPSAADQASTFSYAIDWDGNGSIDETLSGPNSRSAAHAYAQTGVFTISMTATDKDGGVSAAVSLTVTVRGGIHVGGIVMYVASCNGVPRSCVRAGVKPLSTQGQIVPGAVVTALVTAPGRAPATLTATADGFGWAAFDIPISGAGVYTLTVTNLTAPFLDYAPESNVVTSASYRFDGAIRRR